MTDQQVKRDPFSCDSRGRSIPVITEGRHYEVDPDTGCWNWLLHTLKGYGRTNGGQAHRAAWRQAGLELDDSMDLHHRCENALCVNPDHMEPKTKVAHLREHWATWQQLSPEVIAEIKRLTWETTMTQQEIADQFMVSRQSVVRISQGWAWGEDGEQPRKPERTCLFCGEPVGAEKRRQAVFCCAEHRVKYNARKLTERRRAERQEAA